MTTPTRGSLSLSGRTLAGKYQLLERVGAGAMGEVWAANHLSLDKKIAVKVVRVDAHTDALIIGRFKSEARAASRLDHPNSVRIIDYGEEQDGLLFIAMEFLRGQDLGTLLKRTGRVSEQRALRILDQILGALSVAHQASIIHRDLKPANIMLVKDADGAEQVKVCDFGIAKLQDPLGSEDPTGMMTLTRAGAVVGTPSYMSPEQAAGKRVDARADLFSCGVIAYHMLTGDKPFKSETLMGLLTQVMHEDPRPLGQRVSTVDQRVEQLVLRAMAKNPNERFQSAREMRAAVLDILEHPTDRTMAMSGPAPDTTRMFSSDGASATPTTRPPDARPQAAPMASLAGGTLSGAQHTGTWSSRTFDRAPDAGPASKAWMLWVAAALVVAALGIFVVRPYLDRPTVGTLGELVEGGSWGAAEDYALEGFDVFRQDELAKASVRDAMASRRRALGLSKETEIDHDPAFVPSASEWTGYVEFQDSPERPAFTLSLTEVGDGVLVGHQDWPDTGIRARIVGFYDGNHLLIWDSEILMENVARQARFNINDKSSLLMTEDRLEGFVGHYRGHFVAKRTD